MSVDSLAAKLRDGEITCREVVASCLEALAGRNASLNAFVKVLHEEALREASRADEEMRAGRYRGPLHGIPVSVKDVFHVRNVACTAGSKLLADNVKAQDSTVVRRLREAGAIIVGTNNLDEFSLGVAGLNPFYGPVRNPWNLEHMAGGSSGGSAAAVAAGLVSVSIGTDADGSVRIPSSFCGVVGFKPSYGRVSMHGVLPVCRSLEAVGIIAPTVRDVAIVLKQVAGYDPEDDSTVYAEVEDYSTLLSIDVDGTKLCMPEDVDGCSREVEAKFTDFVRVLEKIGVVVEAVKLKRLDYFDFFNPLMFGEAAAIHDEWFTGNWHVYGESARMAIQYGRRVSAVEYLKAWDGVRSLKRDFQKLLEQYHGFVCPTTPTPAVKLAELETKSLETFRKLAAYTIPYNLTELPAISIPVGLSSQGLPVSVQIAGRVFDESRVLRIAHQAMKRIRFTPKASPASFPC
ncbi:MAG: amidase [Candidatus Caldarchaeum sp.]